MKRSLIAPPKPTNDDLQKLNNFFYLPGWQFDALIEDKCTEISVTSVSVQKNELPKVFLYGLMAIKVDSEKDCIANFFVKFGNMVYQFSYIE